MYTLDLTDVKILKMLQHNARTSLKEIAANVYLTPPAVSARINKLETAGVIKGYHAQIDPSALRMKPRAFSA